MDQSIQFFLPTKIIFGRGSINLLPDLIPENQQNILMITGKNFIKSTGLLNKLTNLLSKKKITLYDSVVPEPSTELVEKGLEIAKSEQVEVVISIGGGSSIDVGKAIAAMVNEFSRLPSVCAYPFVEDYLEGANQQKHIKCRGIPFIAIPTTAGTGAEVTKNAVLVSKLQKSKRSLRSELLFPTTAIIDPELTLTLQAHITAQSGMDALTHLIEGYLTKNSNPFTDTIALTGIKLVNSALVTAVKYPDNYTAREKMSLAALYGGIMISNSGLGLVHGISAIIGGEFNIPHGLANAILLPYVLEFNAGVCSEKFTKIACVLSDEIKSGITTEISEFVINRIKNISKEIGIPEKFTEFSITKKDIESIAKKSLSSSSTRGNPREVKLNDVAELLSKCIG